VAETERKNNEMSCVDSDLYSKIASIYVYVYIGDGDEEVGTDALAPASERISLAAKGRSRPSLAVIEKTRKNGRNLSSVRDGLRRGAMTRSEGLESAMDRMDRPCTSADERVLSGLRAVVMCGGLLRGAQLFFADPSISREQPHCAVSD